MPALAERTKIRTGSAHIPTTTGLVLHGGGFPEPYVRGWSDAAIETNIYLIASGSTKVQTQQYFSEPSPKAKDMLRKIYQFKGLPANWDGNDAVPPNDQVINSAADFLCLTDEYDLPIYFTAPGPNGEIVLEYKMGGNTAEVFYEDENISEMILYTEKKQVYAGNISLKRLIEHLRTISVADAR